MHCPDCGESPYHFIARARASRRWRGKSFDADQAMGSLGLALMEALELKTSEFQHFRDLVLITPYRESTDLNPASEIPAEGEWWDFHVAVRKDVGREKVEAMKQAAREALEEAQSFESPEIRA